MCLCVPVERHDKCRELVCTLIRLGCFEPCRVLCKLIEHNQDLTAAEDSIKEILAGGSEHLSGILYLSVQSLASDLISEFSPKGIGDEPVAHVFAYRDLVAGDTHNSNAPGIGQILFINNIGNIFCDIFSFVGNMNTCDKGVRLTAAKSGLHSLDRRGAHVPGYPAEDIGNGLFQAVCGVRSFFEENMRIRIDLVDSALLSLIVLDHRSQRRSKNLRIKGALYDTRARFTGFDYSFQNTTPFLFPYDNNVTF